MSPPGKQSSSPGEGEALSSSDRRPASRYPRRLFSLKGATKDSVDAGFTRSASRNVSVGAANCQAETTAPAKGKERDYATLRRIIDILDSAVLEL